MKKEVASSSTRVNVKKEDTSSCSSSSSSSSSTSSSTSTSSSKNVKTEVNVKKEVVSSSTNVKKEVASAKNVKKEVNVKAEVKTEVNVKTEVASSSTRVLQKEDTGSSLEPVKNVKFLEPAHSVEEKESRAWQKFAAKTGEWPSTGAARARRERKKHGLQRKGLNSQAINQQFNKERHERGFKKQARDLYGIVGYDEKEMPEEVRLKQPRPDPHYKRGRW